MRSGKNRNLKEQVLQLVHKGPEEISQTSPELCPVSKWKAGGHQGSQVCLLTVCKVEEASRDSEPNFSHTRLSPEKKEKSEGPEFEHVNRKV